MKNEKLHPVHQTHDGYFNTVSGKRINLHDVTSYDIELTDIVEGLSKICRFGNQIPNFYTVAQHSIYVAYLAEKATGDHDLCRAALLHDASEAYLGDVIKPLKNVIGQVYTDIEDRFTAAIFDRLNVKIELLPYVKPFDKIALENEFNSFFKGELNGVGDFWARILKRGEQPWQYELSVQENAKVLKSYMLRLGIR